MIALHKPDTEGSLEYQGKWNVFDQFLMSANLVNGKWKSTICGEFCGNFSS